MNKEHHISAVIITHNEEQYIGQCIASLQGVADEVIVVDSYSTDNTEAICQEQQATFYTHQWMGYSATKNWGNSKASHNWILSIDADEILSPLLIENLIHLKKDGLDPEGIYSFNRLNNYCGQWIRHAGWYPDTKDRLFYKSNVKWEGEVHEELSFEKSTVRHHIKGDLLHYSIRDKEDHVARIHKYNKLARKYPNRLAAYLSAISTFIKLYIVKLGFLDGRLGFQLCLISAKAKIWRGQA